MLAHRTLSFLAFAFLVSTTTATPTWPWLFPKPPKPGPAQPAPEAPLVTKVSEWLSPTQENETFNLDVRAGRCCVEGYGGRWHRNLPASDDDGTRNDHREPDGS